MQVKASRQLLGRETVPRRHPISSSEAASHKMPTADFASRLAGSWRFEFKLVPIAACHLRSISQRGAMRDDDLYLCFIERAYLV